MHCRQILSTISLLLFLGMVGCKAAPKPNREINDMLRTVSYDARMPVQPDVSSPSLADVPAVDPSIQPPHSGPISGKVKSGLKSTSGWMMRLVSGIFESAFGLNDHEEIDTSTSRGRADLSFNRWTEARERWRKDDR